MVSVLRNFISRTSVSNTIWNITGKWKVQRHKYSSGKQPAEYAFELWQSRNAPAAAGGSHSSYRKWFFDELLQKLEGLELTFTGKMKIAFVQTKSHPKQKFATEGMLFLNGVNRSFSFISVLEHFPRGNASCILSGDFVINLDEYNITNLLPGEEKVTVRFNQLVLKRPGEQ